MPKREPIKYLKRFSTIEKSGTRTVYPVFVKKTGRESLSLDVSLTGKSNNYLPMSEKQFVEWLASGEFSRTYPNASVRCAIDEAEKRPEESRIDRNGYSVSHFYKQTSTDSADSRQQLKATKTPDGTKHNNNVAIDESVEKALTALAELECLDKQTVQTAREEQAALRYYLMQGEANATCVLCNQNLPSDLLVAAHLKKRATCITEERLQFDRVAALMCKLGCDDLYEKGYVSVIDSTVQLNTAKSLTPKLTEYVSHIVGNSVANWLSSKPFYQWHAIHHKMAKETELEQQD